MADGITDLHKGMVTPNNDMSIRETDLETLRRLLLGPEYQSILNKTEILDNPVLLGQLITPAIHEALKLNTTNNNLQKTLTPTVVGALMDSVSNDPKPIADALYPVMGPAIRKSISSTMDQMTQNFNQLLEQSVSPKALQWRFDAWRTGRSYAEVAMIKNLVFQVEQVFLIHRETGLLLQHVLADAAISKDPDMVSGMLTAIQDFTSDSFSVEQNSGLNSLKLGDLTVLIENGPHAVLAAVVRGSVPNDMREVLSETVEKVHSREHKKLIHYKGDSSGFDHLRPLLSGCLKTQLVSNKNETAKKDKPKKNKLFKYGIYLGLLMLVSAFMYSHYHSGLEQEEWSNIQKLFRSEPGLVVTSSRHENGKYYIDGLADPLAKKPSLLINHGTQKNIEVELAFRPYLSLDSDIILRRIQESFNIPDSVKLSLNDQKLYLVGKSTRSWLKEFESEVIKISGVKSLDTSKVNIVSSN